MMVAFGCCCSLLVFPLFMASTHTERVYSHTLSLVIPATFDDYRCFVHQLLRSLARSYVFPDEVIMVLSGVPRGYKDDVDSVFRDTLPDNVQVIFVREWRLHNQAVNKNVGASIASGDLVLFFDIDDVLHPWGIHTAKQAYQYNSLSMGTCSAIMFSHQHFSEKKLSSLSKSHRVPRCTVQSKKECTKIARVMQRSRGSFLPGKLSGGSVFQPFCTSSPGPCNYNSHYRSTMLYDSCFAQHVASSGHSSANWCCLTDSRPMFAAGWLLVNRDAFLGLRFKETLDIAEDGELIGRFLGTGQTVKYVDVPIGYYNQDHSNPRCTLNHENGFRERNMVLLP